MKPRYPAACGVLYMWRMWLFSDDRPMSWEWAPDMTTADGW